MVPFIMVMKRAWLWLVVVFIIAFLLPCLGISSVQQPRHHRSFDSLGMKNDRSSLINQTHHNMERNLALQEYTRMISIQQMLRHQGYEIQVSDVLSLIDALS